MRIRSLTDQLFSSLLVSQIRMRMGEFDFSSVQEPYPFVERGVNKKIVHPKYNFFTYEYDLALVRLEEPITFQPNIAPICLPATDESLIGQNGVSIQIRFKSTVDEFHFKRFG